MSDEQLGAADVARIGSALTDEDKAILVGGQALNLWAERYYDRAPELRQFGPYTSKDVDYFGHRAAAVKLASSLGGSVEFPTPDDHTCNTAVVTAKVHGRMVTIDFISDVIGVDASALAKSTTKLVLPYRMDDGTQGQLSLPILSPLECLQSRLGNIITLGRNSDLAYTQANAAPYVLREHIRRHLELDQVRLATRTLQRLFHWLYRDPIGTKAHLELRLDPLEILREFAHDPRIDERYRQRNLSSMVARLESARARIAKRRSLLGLLPR